MTGKNQGLVRKGEQFGPDAAEKQLPVAARKIPASHAPGEENIAADKGFRSGMVEADAPRTMPRHVKNTERLASKRHAVAFVQQDVRAEWFDVESESEAPEKCRIRCHRLRVRMIGHLTPVAALDLRRIGGVVVVSVREDEKLDRVSREVFIGPLGCVEEDATLRGFEQKGIRIECPAGEEFEPIHGLVVRKCMPKFDFRGFLCKVFAPIHMRFLPTARVATAAAALVAFTILPLHAGLSSDPGQVAVAVARWLEQAHYAREKLDDQMSARLLATYLEALDYNKLYFTQADVDEFQKKYATGLDDAIFRGDLTAAREIFERFKQRVEARVESNKKLAKKDYDFKGNHTVELNRQKAPWPKDQAEADALWAARVEAELLQENLNEFKPRPPVETVTRRYDQALRNVREMDDEDVVKTFLSSLAQSYDPHSEYMSPSDMENFNIAMKLSLVGVGAVLRSDDGYARVMEVVPGGPADSDGRLKVGDRIAAVAQGDEDFEDVVDMKLNKVVEKIRGKKGSTVRLQVIPADAADPSKRRVIEIVRDEVKLKDQEAKAEVLDLKDAAGATKRIGWITLPSFYANMGGGGPAKSTTEDVAALLGRLKQEGIEGLVIDLRKDGGGSLEEAINLTGLFIPKGPVVQSKDPNGKITVSSDTNPGVAYTGPLVVVMNRLSASASEIFAAALQDYGRAVIVGDERSFGKGTVQTVLDIGRVMPFFSLGAADAGALKVTIQKFYRVKGGSTQLKGVESDIVLPSRTDNPEIGEGSLKNRLEYDEVAPARLPDIAFPPLFLDQLRERSAARVATDPEFLYVSEDMQRLRERIAANKISVNEAERRKELADDKARRETRKAERLARGPLVDVQAYQLTLDDVRNKNKLVAVAYEREREKRYEDPEETEAAKAEEDKGPEPDPIRNETLRIISDFIEFMRGSKTAQRSES